jgi:hypothetical protein
VSLKFLIRLAKYPFLLLAAAAFLSSPIPVRADVAPPAPAAGSNLESGAETTQVRMLAETVTMEIDADSPYDEGLAQVTASFTMHNLGEEEERMAVRFPLLQSTWLDWCLQDKNFDPISNFSAWVDGHPVETEKNYETVTYLGIEQRSFPCWEQFQVVFPPGKDVIIKVVYTAHPYVYEPGTYGYLYVLWTGAGWKGTIGSADIGIRLPYELDKYNFLFCQMDDCSVSGNEVRWHREEFDPEEYRFGTAEAYIVPPPIWRRILIERENVAVNPNDGEAWGRLGKAYKEAIKGSKGYFRSDPAGIEIYQWSEVAYKKALDLLPADADWQYGYADLLCTHAHWDFMDYVGNEPNAVVAAWSSCFDQLYGVLNLNPSHEKALARLQDFEEFGYVDLSGSQPNYLILTPPAPSPTQGATRTRKPTRTQTVIPSPTSIPSPTATRTPASTSMKPVSIPLTTRTSTNGAVAILPQVQAGITVTTIIQPIETIATPARRAGNLELGMVILVILFALGIGLLRKVQR